MKFIFIKKFYSRLIGLILFSLFISHQANASTNQLAGYVGISTIGPFNTVEVAGNVGIGTTAPGQALDVQGTARMTGFQLGTSTTAGYLLTAAATGVGTYQAPLNGFTSQNVVTSSRALGTVYQNTTGKTMFITVTVEGNTSANFHVYTDSSSSPSTIVLECQIYANTANATMSFMVLNNNYYEVGTAPGAVLDHWVEWY